MNSRGLRWPQPLGDRVARLLPRGRRPSGDDALVASIGAGIAGMVRELPPGIILELVYDRIGASLGLGPVFVAPPAAQAPGAPPDGDRAAQFAAAFEVYVRQLSRAELVRFAEPSLRRQMLGEEEPQDGALAARVADLEAEAAGLTLGAALLRDEAALDLGRIEDLEEALAAVDAEQERIFQWGPRRRARGLLLAMPRLPPGPTPSAPSSPRSAWPSSKVT